MNSNIFYAKLFIAFLFLSCARGLAAFGILYHGSSTDEIEILLPCHRYTPGTEEDSPSGVYASDDPAFAAAHAFPWSSDEGVELYYDSWEEGREAYVVLAVPPEVYPRLFQSVIIYAVPDTNFHLLDIPPQRVSAKYDRDALLLNPSRRS